MGLFIQQIYMTLREKNKFIVLVWMKPGLKMTCKPISLNETMLYKQNIMPMGMCAYWFL